MSPRAVRRIVVAVCIAGIAGMIVSSIADNNGAALTAGLVTAVAVLCLIVTTAVTAGPADDKAAGLRSSGLVGDARSPEAAEATAAELEAEIEALVADGADEEALRTIVGHAVRLGKERVQ